MKITRFWVKGALACAALAVVGASSISAQQSLAKLSAMTGFEYT